MTGQVTALGIRDGDPAVLNALVSRRGAAVLAYCERACGPARAADAAADAFGRFRATVIATERPSELDPEAALLAATRHAAADRSPAPTATSAGALGRLLGGKAPDQIAEVPALLVARADGSLDPVSEDRLNRLLDASAAARAAEERFHAAEYAYRTAVARPLPPAVSQRVLATMAAITATNGVAAAAEEPVADEVVEEPEPDPEPIEEPEPVAEDEPEIEEPVVQEEPQAQGSIAAEEPEHDPDETVEWSVPPEDMESDGLGGEIAAARLEEPPPVTPPPVTPPPVTPPPPPQTGGIPRLSSERPHFPGRSAFAPAAAVVTVAAIGAMVASGVFGGNEETPQLDTGIVRPRAVNAIPEGEAKTVISDLRDSAAQARRQRLADKADTVATAPPEEATPPATESDDEETATDEQETPAPAEPEGENDETPAQPAPEQEQPSGQADGGETGGAVPGDTP